MITPLLLVFVRNLKRHGVYKLLNVVGLATCMAVCLLILLLLQQEFSYDIYHKEANRIYRVLRYRVSSDAGNGYYSRGLEGPAGPAFLSEIPEVEAMTRFITRPMWAGISNRGFKVSGTIADDNFLTFFTFPTIHGRTVSQITPGTVYLTERLAKKLFGSIDVVGRSIRIEFKWLEGDFLIADVLRDPPSETSAELLFDLVVSRHASTSESISFNWENWRHSSQSFFIYTFIRLTSGTTPENLREKLDKLASRHWAKGVSNQERYDLLPLLRTHLYAKHDFKLSRAKFHPPFGDIYHCYALAFAGGFLLLIACINFVNLVTAHAEDRALEVGIHKVLGATRLHLAKQFLFAMFLMSTCSSILAMVLAQAAIPLLNGFFVTNLSLNFWSWIFCLIMAIVTGLCAGVYPALFLSNLHPSQALKKSRTISIGRSYLRQGLVITQFTIAVVLIIVTLIVQAQMYNIRTINLGFKKDGLVVIPLFREDQSLLDKFETIRARFLESPDVVGFTASAYPPGWENTRDVRKVNRPGMVDSITVHRLPVDHDFTNVYDISIREGRAFSPNERDRDKYLLFNQTASQRLGGLGIGDIVQVRNSDYTVIGIFEDFHNNTLYNPIGPLFLEYSVTYNYVTLDIQTENIQRTMDFLEDIWKAYLPNRSFEFQFLDEHLDLFYSKERRIQQVVTILSLLTIFVACFGLLGLIAHTVQVRNKEIAVRKVLGASVPQIVLLLVKDQAILVIIANVIAAPIAYIIAENWLDQFAYRIDLGLGLFLIGGFLSLIIALTTIITQTIRAAQANSVNALRSE
ncbi:MAG: ABC transporter permease [Gemmatimonadetes bacterium]|nr:ABC transporter permease [Gemmatimonadota bacterium]